MRAVQRAGVVFGTLAMVLALSAAGTQVAKLSVRRWRISYVSGVGNSNMFSVLATGRRDAWAIATVPGGRTVRVPGGRTVLLRWNGTRWRRVRSPGPASFDANALAASGRSDIPGAPGSPRWHLARAVGALDRPPVG